jgi:hypothetical protein
MTTREQVDLIADAIFNVKNWHTGAVDPVRVVEYIIDHGSSILRNGERPTCPECGATWTPEHNRCSAQCQNKGFDF